MPPSPRALMSQASMGAQQQLLHQQGSMPRHPLMSPHANSSRRLQPTLSGMSLASQASLQANPLVTANGSVTALPLLVDDSEKIVKWVACLLLVLVVLPALVWFCLRLGVTTKGPVLRGVVADTPPSL